MTPPGAWTLFNVLSRAFGKSVENIRAKLIMRELDKKVMQVTDPQALTVIRDIARGIGISEASVKVINEPRLVKSAEHWALGMVIRGPTGDVFYMQEALLNSLVQNPNLVGSLIKHENKERDLINHGVPSEYAHSIVISNDPEQLGLMQVAGDIAYQVKKDEVLKAVVTAEGLFASGNFKAGIFEAMNALAGAKLAGEKLYNETATSIMKMLINVRDASGIKVSPVYEENLFTTSLSSALNIMLFLMKQKSKSQPDSGFNKEQTGTIINETMQEAVVRNIVDQEFRNFAAGEVINGPKDHREELLRNMGFGWLSRFVFSHFRNEESQKNVVLFALDGRTINSLHCAVVAVEKLLNNEKIRDFLMKNEKIDLSKRTDVTLEKIAQYFALEVVSIVKQGKATEFLEQLKSGLLSPSTIQKVVLERFGVSLKAKAETLQGLLQPAGDSYLPVIIHVPNAQGMDGKLTPHFMLFGGPIAAINGKEIPDGVRMVLVEDRHLKLALPEDVFAKKFEGREYIYILALEGTRGNARELAQLEERTIFGGDGKVIEWIGNKDAINLAGISERDITLATEIEQPGLASPTKSSLAPTIAAMSKTRWFIKNLRKIFERQQKISEARYAMDEGAISLVKDFETELAKIEKPKELRDSQKKGAWELFKYKNIVSMGTSGGKTILLRLAALLECEQGISQPYIMTSSDHLSMEGARLDDVKTGRRIGVILDGGKSAKFYDVSKKDFVNAKP